MRILILNADYPKFLGRFYGADPALAEASYEEQLAARADSLFGVADFYSRNLRRHGHEAWEIHVNNLLMQSAWAREHGINVGAPAPPSAGPALYGPMARTKAALKNKLRPLVRKLVPRQMSALERRILSAQIAHYRPDVILNQEVGYVRNEFLKTLTDRVPFIMGQIATALPQGERFDVYQLVISSLPNQVAWFKQQGVAAELNWLAFEPVVLEKLGPPPEPDIDVSFVGSLSDRAYWRSRVELLEFVARHVDLKIWGNGIEQFPASSPLHRCYQGEAWGRDMYQVLRRSRITINNHSKVSEDYANNMRLYEATGAGCLMLVDHKKNLQDMFDIGEHIATYRSPEECVAQIQRYLADEAARARIARAGQRHTMEVHSYYRRMGELIELIQYAVAKRAA